MVGNLKRSGSVERLACSLAAAALVVVGCGGPDSSPGTTAGSPSSTARAASPASGATSSGPAAGSVRQPVGSGSSTAAGGAMIAADDGPLGRYLVDGAGRALYLFTADTVQGQSACYDACAATWPPVTTSAAPTAGEDAAGGELSTITRTDGSTQVVYGEYPLYYFAGDTGPGQTNGQGSGGQWWIVGLNGEPVKTVTGSPAVTSGTTY
jgi:predicted lipoprotein with Yx(FWY)xxD motif